jgi:hypothetical protein
MDKIHVIAVIEAENLTHGTNANPVADAGCSSAAINTAGGRLSQDYEQRVTGRCANLPAGLLRSMEHDSESSILNSVYAGYETLQFLPFGL